MIAFLQANVAWVSFVIGARVKDRAWQRWPFTRYPGLRPRGERFFHRWGQ